MPGYCDLGSVNRAALAGLLAGLRWLSDSGRGDRLELARGRVAQLQNLVRSFPGVALHGTSAVEDRMPTLALTVNGLSPRAMADELATRGVIASGGLQCAPLAHQSLGTSPEGVLRLSLGPSNTDDDVVSVAEALRECLQRVQAPRLRR